ncbi:MAG: hypothetical protein ACXABY_04890 [Candidatus Thorarchaeota archaeon]|jgi:hypothetical protein
MDIENISTEKLESIESETELLIFASRRYANFPAFLHYVKSKFHASYLVLLRQSVSLDSSEALSQADLKLQSFLMFIQDVLLERYQHHDSDCFFTSEEDELRKMYLDGIIPVETHWNS